jgi:predicted nicotinamide N-methyase
MLQVWDSTYVLVDYLSGPGRHHIAGQRVLELGSGTGIAGLALAPLGPAAAVHLTDLPDVAPLLAANIRLNCALAAAVTAVGRDTADADAELHDALSTRYTASAYSWGDPVDPLRTFCDGFDVVVASDVVYDPGGYAPLVASLALLLAAPGTVAILAHRHRHPENQRFFDLLGACPGMVVDRIDRGDVASVDGTDAGATVDGPGPGQGQGQAAVLRDVELYSLCIRSPP